jgi:hypothetical protein
MFDRIVFLRGATALLYMGPILAGLSGFGWELVPVFALLFILWLLLRHPDFWPVTSGAWQDGAAWLPLVGRSLAQVFLITILFGFGHGLGGILDFAASVPFWIPVALSCLSIPLGWIVWSVSDEPRVNSSVL